MKDRILVAVEEKLDAVQFATKHLNQNSSNFVRCIIVDFSFAFNTVQPHKIIDECARYIVTVGNGVFNKQETIRQNGFHEIRNFTDE